MRCPSCGHDVPESPFCERCGKSLINEKVAPIDPKSDPSLGSKPSSPARSVEQSGAAPDAKVAGAPDNANSHPRWYGIVWATLAIAMYVAIADAAVETFLRQSPLRWWIAGAAALYLGLCVASWRLLPGIWRRMDWATQAAVSLVVLLVLLGATAWMPEGLDRGLSLFGQTTSTVFAVVSAVVVALSGVLLARLPFIPVPGKIAVGLLAAYGVAAFLLAVHAETPYASLFHGGSQWTRLPFWLQGAIVGGLLVMPLALLLEIATRIRRITRGNTSEFAFKVIALCMSLVIIVAAVRTPADNASAATASALFAVAQPAVGAPPPDAPTSVTSENRPPSSPEQNKSNNERHLASAQKWKSIIESYVAAVPASATDLNSLADSLRKPEAAFEYVRDQIALEPYPGAMKGAAATLVTHGGNDLDRSLLLATVLSAQGVEVQIAHGELTPAQAQSRLLQIEAKPDATELILHSIPRASFASSPPMRQIDAFTAANSQRRAQIIEQNYSLLNSSLKSAKIAIGLDQSAAQLKSLQDHYWVRAVVDGKTIDLDPGFEQAEYGRKYADVAETINLNGLDSARLQTMTLRLVADYLEGGTIKSRNLLESEFNTIDLWGKNIRLAILPNAATEVANDFRATLSVGDDLAGQQVFQLRVTPVDKPSGPQGNNSLWGGLVGGTTGAEAPNPEPTGAVLARIYLEVDVRGPLLEPSHSRRFILDRLASSGEAARLDPAMTGDDIAGALLTQVWDGAVGVGTIDPLYLAKTTIAWINADIDAQNALIAANPAQEVKPSDLPGPLLSPELLTFFLSSGNTEHQIQMQFAPQVRAYYQHPRLAFIRRGFAVSDWADASKRVSYREGIDIINSPFGFAGHPEQQTALAMRWGAADTALELRFSLNGGDAFNTLPLMAAANSAKVPMVTIGPAQKAALTSVSVPASIKAALDRDLIDDRAIVAPEHLIDMNGTHTYGWWSIERDTGYAIGKMELGGAQGLTEYTKLQQTIPKQSYIAGGMMGDILRCYMGGVASVLGGAASKSTADCVQSACCKAINELLDMEVDDSMTIALLTEDEEELSRVLKLEAALVKFDSKLPVTAVEEAQKEACGGDK
jgi:hypothetical protein